VLYLLFPAATFIHLLLWTFIAVGFHIFVDIFNAYGTQAVRPFKETWVAFGFINTFDWFIFGSHVVAIAALLLGSPVFATFVTLYVILALYYVARFCTQRMFKPAVQNIIPDSEEIIIASTIHFF
ncbi:metal-dependent hydrolase, partial [Listeria monocytogenes]|uniref:metal-dependent hydrolase n=1 Tax=Listeria monocytogenes TaxID=1639 RepID=UPI0006A4B30F